MALSSAIVIIGNTHTPQVKGAIMSVATVIEMTPSSKKVLTMLSLLVLRG